MKIVKLIPPSYFSLMKNGFVQPHYLIDRSKENILPVLGGEYKVLKERDNEYYKYVIDVSEEHSTRLPTDFFQIFSEDMICPYKAGEQVVFSPTQCSEDDIYHLTDLSGGHDLEISTQKEKRKKYEIQYILNRYYIFINKDFIIDDEGYVMKGFPFRWIDFEVVVDT